MWGYGCSMMRGSERVVGRLDLVCLFTYGKGMCGLGCRPRSSSLQHGVMRFEVRGHLAENSLGTYRGIVVHLERKHSPASLATKTRCFKRLRSRGFCHLLITMVQWKDHS